MLANVKIEQDKENKHIHRVFVDGKQIDRITHLDFQVNPSEFPSVTLNIEQMSGVDFEGQAEVNFLNNPFTVQDACKILREELLKYGDLYDGFVASMISAVLEETYIPAGVERESLEMSARKACEKIFKRIIGED